MPREEIGLEAMELRAFLGAARTAILVTVGDGAHPGGELVEVALSGEDGLVVWPTAVARAAIGADPRVCVIVEEQPDYAGIRGVLVHGTARSLDDDRRHGAVLVPLDDMVSFDFARLRVNRPPVEPSA